MSSSLKLSNFLVSGASRGLGLSIVKLLLEHSNVRVIAIAKTLFNDLHSDSLTILKDNRVTYISLDLATITDTSFTDIINSLGITSIQGFIHCAGIITLSPISSSKISDWKTLFQINLFSAISITQAILPLLRNQTPPSKVILISSGASISPYNSWSSYCCSKASLNMFVSCLSKEEPSVVCLAVRPGIIDTDMQKQAREEGKSLLGCDFEKFQGLKDRG